MARSCTRVLLWLCNALAPFALCGQPANFDIGVPSEILHNYATHGMLSSISYRGKPISIGSKIMIMGPMDQHSYDEIGDYIDLRGIAMIGQRYAAVRCYVAVSEFRKLQSQAYVYESMLPGHSQPEVAIEGTVFGVRDGNLVITDSAIVPWNIALTPRPPSEPPQPSPSKSTVTGRLIYLPPNTSALQAHLLENGRLVVAYVDQATWNTLKKRVVDGPCVTLTGTFDSETQAYVVKQLRAGGEKRDILAIHGARFDGWKTCTGDEFGAAPPPRKPLITPLARQRPECQPYAPTAITVSGHMEAKVFAGPPNYADIKKGDRPEEQWLLTLKAPLCTNGSRVSQAFWQPSSKTWADVVDEYGAVEGVMQLQLLFPAGKSDDKYKDLLNTEVVITGVLFQRTTAHHRTPVMLQVFDIQAQRASGGQ